MKHNIIFIWLIFSMIGSIYAQDNIINEIAQGGKFIVRDDEHNTAMVIENGNVGFGGTLKLEVLPKGDVGNSIVVWDPDDKILKLQNQNLSTALNSGFNSEGWYALGYGGLENDNTTSISASVHNTSSVAWNRFSTDYGYIQFGPANQSAAHIYTDRNKFLFNKSIFLKGSFSAFSGYNLIFKTNNTPRLTILESNGNVGIGIINPSAKLEVAGQVKITGGAPGIGKVLMSNATGLATWQRLQSNTVESNTLWIESGNDVYRSDGMVGIGTSNPKYSLDLKGDFRIISSGDNDGQFRFSGVNGDEALFRMNNGNNFGLIAQSDGNTPKMGSYTGGSIQIYPYSDLDELDTVKGALTTFDFANMKVGIGTTYPSAKLDVNGTATAKRYIANGVYNITNGIWDISQSNIAQINYSSGIIPITINSDGTVGTYVLIVKKNSSCSDCNIYFSGADVKYPSGINPTLSSGPNSTDVFSFIAVGNNTFYCLYAKNLL